MVGELVVDEQFEVLPVAEQQRRDELEAIIKTRLQAFVEFCLAMHEIKGKRLYRSTHNTWESYCEDNLGVSRQSGVNYANAGEVIELIQENVNSCLQNGTIMIPQNEAQARPLTKYKKEPEKLLEVWNKAVDAAPEGKVTAKIVKDAITNIVQEKEKGTIDKLDKQKEALNKDELTSSKFDKAMNALIGQVVADKGNGYKKTSREAIVKHLDALRGVIAEDGDRIGDRVAMQNRPKLMAAGFAFIRRDIQQLIIEKEDNTAIDWQIVQTYQTAKALNEAFESLLKTNDNYLRG